MGNFSRGRAGSGRGFSSKGGSSSGWEKRSFNDRGSRGPVQMHPAVCDNCNKSCEVPFRPTGGKPIFCSSCFENQRGSDSRRFESRNSERPASFSSKQENNGKNYQEQFDQLNHKLDKLLEILTPKTTE